MTTATDPQRDRIAELALELRLRQIDPWETDLTQTQASDLIDQLQLRRLSQKVNRPVTVRLNDRDAVRRELDRVRALAGETRSRQARVSGNGTNGVRVTHIPPQPRRPLTARQERDRRAQLDRGPIEPYATGRFSESTGYGGHASYSVQQAERLGEQRDAPEITDGQERYIIDLQQQARDTTVVAETVAQASDEIDRLTQKGAPAQATTKAVGSVATVRVLNKRRDEIPREAIYVGRPTRWGNPFTHLTGRTRAQFHVESARAAVDAYREWIQHQPELLASIGELRGKDLVCWCAPAPCHAEVLAELANRERPQLSTPERAGMLKPAVAEPAVAVAAGNEMTAGGENEPCR